MPAFIPLLACYDLTRTAALPASDGCAGSTSADYKFYGHANIREFALYLQDAITVHNWTFNLGVRFDRYDGITKAAQGEPRLGIAYNFKPTNTVLRVSYARTMETPFNENLVLASLGCNDPVIAAFQTLTGDRAAIQRRVSPGHRNEFHAGLQQAFRKTPGDRRRVHLEVHARGVRFQRSGQHADHFSDRMGKLENSRICHPRHRAELPRIFGICGDVERGGALLRPAGFRHRRGSGRRQRISHRSR